jgi:hypothetical protein
MSAGSVGHDRFSKFTENPIFEKVPIPKKTEFCLRMGIVVLKRLLQL